MQHGFKTKCEKLALEWRQKFGLRVTDALSAHKVAEDLETQIFTPHDIPGLNTEDLDQLLSEDGRSWSAVTFWAKDLAFIIHNVTHSERRQQSNLMHEMSHQILGHAPIRFVNIPGIPFPIREYRTDDEDEANWLTGCMLIPRDGLLWAVRRSMSNERISDHFNSSIDIANFRRNITGVDKQMRPRRRR